MSEKHSNILKHNARTLRKHMTKEELKLWFGFLKRSGHTVHRQKVFGHYIVDFYIAKFKLVIELDGSQHFEESGIKKDRKRDEYLRSLGLTVLRYANNDVNRNFAGVCQDILEHMKDPPHQSP